MKETSAAFELRDVEVSYGDFAALQGLDLGIGRGEAVAFVGPSGAGKTTALGLLNGLSRATRGRVLVNGEELGSVSPKRLREIRSQIGYIPQDLGLVPNLRVAQNVLAGRLGRRGLGSALRSLVLPARSELEGCLAILERLGIGDKLYQRTDSLSGGEMQRVAIARALFQGANALLADEPLSALDPARSREILALLLEVAREHGMTLVLSMHDITLARELVPRLIGLKRGRVLFDRAAADVAHEELDRLYELDGKGGDG